MNRLPWAGSNISHAFSVQQPINRRGLANIGAPRKSDLRQPVSQK